jgi:uncharacterized membrane protein
MVENDKTPQTDAKKKTDALGVWIAIGAGVGTGVGVMFGEIALGIALGAGFGVAIGSVVASRGDGRRTDRHDSGA